MKKYQSKGVSYIGYKIDCAYHGITIDRAFINCFGIFYKYRRIFTNEVDKSINL